MEEVEEATEATEGVTEGVTAEVEDVVNRSSLMIEHSVCL